MKSFNSMDFTIAVAPSSTSIVQDMLFIKSALLYSDTITLVSPLASTYYELTNESNRRNEKALFKLINKVLPFCQAADPVACMNMEQPLEQFGAILNSRQYNSVPLSMKISIRKALNDFGNGISQTLSEMLGIVNCEELVSLVKENRVKLHNFQNIFTDSDNFSHEFYDIIKQAVSSTKTFPLLDDLSNNLIKSAINDNAILLNKTNIFEAQHARLASNLLIALPAFEYATTAEVLDIRKELDKPLNRFRSKLFSYESEIQTMPWDEDFEFECIKLYQKEISPAVLEIDELTKESSFIKNLGYNIISDNSTLKAVGELAITITLAGAVSAFTDVLSTNQALIATGGAYATSKIASLFKEYRDKQKDIKRKDMYFYYKAGNLLEKAIR